MRRVTPQQQTSRAREVFRDSFSSEEDRSDYYQNIALISAERRRERLILTPEEVAQLRAVYLFLGQIAARAPAPKPILVNADEAPTSDA